MNLSFILTEEDIIRFNVFHINRSPKRKKVIFWQKVLTPIFFFLLAFLFSRITDQPQIFLFILAAIAGVVWFFYYPKYFQHSVTRQVTNAVKKKRVKMKTGQYQLLMTDKGYTYVKPEGRQRESWKSIEEFVEDEETFYLYNSPYSAIVLPKRELEKPEEVKTFITNQLSPNN